MILKRIINWKDLYNSIHPKWSGRDYLMWNELQIKYKNTPIDNWTLIANTLFNHKDFNRAVSSVNSVFRNYGDMQIPYMDYDTYVAPDLDLVNLLLRFQASTHNHTIYAYAGLRLVMKFASSLTIDQWIGAKLSDYQDGVFKDVLLPRWLRIIMDRQKQLGINAGLGDDGPLLFVMLWNDYRKQFLVMRSLRTPDFELSKFNYILNRLTNGTIVRHATDYKKFCGLSKGAILQNVMAIRRLPLLGRQVKDHKKLHQLHHLVGILDYSGRHKRVYDFGYLLREEEQRGVYLIHGTKGIYYVPRYLITQPAVRTNRIKDNALKDELYKLGYESKEFYQNIKTHRQLIDHTITPHRI